MLKYPLLRRSVYSTIQIDCKYTGTHNPTPTVPPTKKGLLPRWQTQNGRTMKQSHCETVYSKRLSYQRLFLKFVHSFWSKIGNPNFNWWWVMVWTISKWVNFYFKFQFDLEGQGQLPHKTIGILTKVAYTSDPNLVILAWIYDELSCGQTHDRHTHTQMQATIPRGHDWPRVRTTIL